MSEVLLIVLLVLAVAILGCLIFSIIKRPKGFENLSSVVEAVKNQFEVSDKILKANFENLANISKQFNEILTTTISSYNKDVVNYLSATAKAEFDQLNKIENRLNEILKDNSSRLDKVLQSIEGNLKSLQDNNEKKLEQMRVTVDEKLSATLEKRLNESIKVISSGIDTVSKNLGEMQNIASGMGDLKRVLTNVKTRGGWGEVQLSTLLNQMLSPTQFAEQVSTKANGERVDFVINMPGKNSDTIWLPVDAKFPIEDYIRLCDASEKNDLKEIETHSKNLERKIKEEAKSINQKYINVPKTTDFAVMYLPVEGLYAEISKRPALTETLQQQYKILICGPSTLTALLNSLQMGFKTLAIEKRSSEIYSLLGTFKQEFSNFVELLSKTQKKIDEASDTIDSATKKTKIIERKLKDVSTIDGTEIEKIDFDSDK